MAKENSNIIELIRVEVDIRGTSTRGSSDNLNPVVAGAVTTQGGSRGIGGLNGYDNQGAQMFILPGDNVNTSDDPVKARQFNYMHYDMLQLDHILMNNLNADYNDWGLPGTHRAIRKANQQEIRKNMNKLSAHSKEIAKFIKINNKTIGGEDNEGFNLTKTIGYAGKALSLGTTAYTMYSQHQMLGYSLSGATHAANQQARKSSAATFGIGIGLSIATGNPWIAAIQLGMRAYQLSQTNRQELYQIRSSQITSSVLQERLVINEVMRRF